MSSQFQVWFLPLLILVLTGLTQLVTSLYLQAKFPQGEGIITGLAAKLPF